MVLDLPDLILPPTTVVTVEPTGQWVDNDNCGDGQPYEAEGKLHLAFRSGRGVTPGGQYRTCPDPGSPFSGWGPITPSLSAPTKAFQSAHATDAVNLDSFVTIRNPATGLYTVLYSCKPGSVTEMQTGFVSTIKRRTSMAPTPSPGSWTSYGAEHLIQVDPVATWEGPYVAVGPSQMAGGIEEPSIVGPIDGEYIAFYVGKDAEDADPFGETLRFRIGRATCPAAVFDSAPVFTRTPAAGPTSYVFAPVEHGADGAYGFTNGTAVNGTSNSVLQPHVSVDADGVFHLIRKGYKPNTGQGLVNATEGLYHHYSLDKGLTWTADSRNPILLPSDFGFNFENGIANKFNSPGLLWQANRVILFVWGGQDGANSPGSRLYGITMNLSVAAVVTGVLPGMNRTRGDRVLKQFYLH